MPRTMAPAARIRATMARVDTGHPVGERPRAAGGGQVGGVDVVLEGHGQAVERPPQLAFRALPVALARHRYRRSGSGTGTTGRSGRSGRRRQCARGRPHQVFGRDEALSRAWRREPRWPRPRRRVRRAAPAPASSRSARARGGQPVRSGAATSLWAASVTYAISEPAGRRWGSAPAGRSIAPRACPSGAPGCRRAGRSPRHVP